MNFIYAILLTMTIMGSVAFVAMRSFITERHAREEAQAAEKARQQAIKLTISEVKP